MDVQWKRGDFLKFYAQMKIRVGGKGTLDIQKGDEFEYDGTIVKYAGTEFPQPGLRGAVRENWATLNMEGGRPINATRPERSVAKATSVNQTFHSVQREEASAPTTNSLDEETVLRVGDRGAVQKSGGHIEQKHNRRIAGNISVSDVDQQDGRTVANIRSPVKFRVEDVHTVNPNSDGVSFEAGYGRADGETGARKFTKEGISVQNNVGNIDAASIRTDFDEGKMVGKIRQSAPVSEGGISAQDTSGNPGVKVAKPVDGGGDGGVSKLDVARGVCPNFPEDWNFFATQENKLQRVKDLKDDPGIIKALFAAEGKKFKKVLKTNYPSVV
jgi:hypothetical protein